MNLIWNEYISFLNNKGLNNFLKENKINLDLKEGYYWLDRSIIKCYDVQGNLHKILRIYIDNNLDLTFKLYKNKKFQIESWQDTIKKNKDKLLQLEKESLELIKNNINKYQDYESVALSSTGKDSMVVWYLTNKINNNTKIIFNNTTLDCADTYKFIKQLNNVKIITPKEGFYQWRKRLNFVPTRFSRACCSIFKEAELVKQLDKDKKYLFFMGMRNQESATRKGYLDEWKNDKWGNRQWQGILPIRKWTEEEIWLYILMKNIPVNPKYKKGYNRIGCVVSCPFYAKSTWVLDKYWYPKMYDRWHNILHDDFIKNNKDIIMNCTEKEYHTCWNGGVYREEPTKEVINQFADRNNLKLEIAKKYFSHSCKECNKRIKNKEVLAMNMKYLGRNTKDFYCKKHLKEKLSFLMNKEFTENDWRSQVKYFTEQGCQLF